jgi:hypothetical protein
MVGNLMRMNISKSTSSLGALLGRRHIQKKIDNIEKPKLNYNA